MTHLMRKPLTWMILGECLVVLALVLLAWHLVAGRALPAAAFALPVAPAPSSTPDPAGALVEPVPSPDSTAAPLPGLNLDPSFWGVHLRDLNADEASFEDLEWRITSAAGDAARSYLESVVLPAVTSAESKR